MEYRRLGKTQLQVSAIAFGGIRLGNLDQELVTQLVKQAYEGGINYIDTARGYGLSEVRLGEAIRQLGIRDKMILSSKIIRRELSQFQEDFATTMRNLQTDYLDILFVHDVSTRANWDKVRTNGVLDYMRELKDKGMIRHICCSTHDAVIGEEMMRSGYFEAVMLAYNPINPELEETLIPLAVELDMGVIVMKPLGGGVLTPEKSAQMGFSVTAAECLRFAASNKQVSTVIPGMEKPEHVAEALAVASAPLEMSEEERKELMGRISIRGRNYCRGCGYCLPCPKGIPIPTVLALLGRWEVFNGNNWAQMHSIATEYKEKVPDDQLPTNCVACGACVQRCPFNLPVPELMKQAANMRRY